MAGDGEPRSLLLLVMPPKKVITVIKAGEKKGKGGAAGGGADPKWVNPSDFDVTKVDVPTAKETATGLWMPVKYDGRPLRFWTGTVRTPTGVSFWDREGGRKWSCAIAIDPDNESACALSEALGRLHVRLQTILRENSADLGISDEEMANLVFSDAVTYSTTRDTDHELSPLFNAYFPLFAKEFSALFVRTGSPDFRVAPGKIQELIPKDTFFMAVVELGGAWFRRATKAPANGKKEDEPPAAGLWFKYHTVRLLTKDELSKVRRPSTQARAVATGLLGAPINSSDTDTASPEAVAASGVPPKKRGAAAMGNGNGTPSPPVDGHGNKRVRTTAPDADEVAVMLAEAE